MGSFLKGKHRLRNRPGVAKNAMRKRHQGKGVLTFDLENGFDPESTPWYDNLGD